MRQRSLRSNVVTVVFLAATLLTSVSLELPRHHQEPQLLETGVDPEGTKYDVEEQLTPDVWKNNATINAEQETGRNETLNGKGWENASETDQEERTNETLDNEDGIDTVKRKEKKETQEALHGKNGNSTNNSEVEEEKYEGTKEESSQDEGCKKVVEENLTGGEHKVVSTDSSLVASLLMDIRDALYIKKNIQGDQVSRDCSEQRLDKIRDETEGSISRISSDFERLKENMDQKVSLVLDTFSTLKLLVLSQGDQLRSLQERLKTVHDQTENFQIEMDKFQRSLKEVNNTLRSQEMKVEITSFYSDNSLPEEHILDPQVNITDYDDRIQETKPVLDDLTAEVQKITAAVKSMRDELEEVKKNITDHTVVSKTNSLQQAQRDTHTSVSDSTSCQCSTDKFREAITKIEEVQKEHNNKLNEIARNLTLMEDQQHHTDNRTWSYSQRIGEVEDSFMDLNSMKHKVNTVQEDLSNLKKELERNTTQGVINVMRDSTNMEGLCVWPYRRGGGGCFYVHTEERLSWQGARDHCRSLQGDLASPTHYNLFKLFILKLRLSRAYTYWIGASDVGKGEWMWIDGRVVTSDVWGNGQPVELNNNCMALKPIYKFVPSAEACRESRFFICQQERQL
ncbi:girdin homolog [Homarus americanus]|uniref:girdin homolog n=1 Tax=Homarus americanus TaxID=6706 RepID=UPI001C438195|nr:girdin homolog [Homarus americanus]